MESLDSQRARQAAELADLERELSAAELTAERVRAGEASAQLAAARMQLADASAQVGRGVRMVGCACCDREGDQRRFGGSAGPSLSRWHSHCVA